MRKRRRNTNHVTKDRNETSPTDAKGRGGQYIRWGGNLKTSLFRSLEIQWESPLLPF